MIIDSTFLHDVIRGDQTAIEKGKELDAARASIEISPITVYEVGIGLRGSAKKHRERFDNAIAGPTIIPFGLDETFWAMDIQHDLYDRGEPIGARDVFIAATAAARDDPRVLTRNVDEFERVEAIDVETY